MSQETVLQTNVEPVTAEQLEKALAAGADYFAHQPSSQFDRCQQLLKLAQLFDDQAEQLGVQAAHDMHKRLVEGQQEAHAAANIIRYYANNGPALLSPKPYVYGQNDAHAQLEYDPLGIVLAVEPWNFPYTQVIRVLAPNYLAGNPVLLKPARSVAGCAQAMVALTEKAGFPTGAFTSLNLSHDQVANVIGDDRIQGVAVTGSTAVGRHLASLAGQNVKPSTLELGGSDACLVLDDADLATAILEMAASRLRNSGQTCTSAKRFIVRREVADQVIDGLTKIFNRQTIGDPLDAATTLAPLASKAGQERLTAQVKLALDHGAKALVKGGAVGETGFQPTLLTNLTADNPASQEEFFGPVAQLYVVDSDEEAIQVANSTPFGLAGSIFSQDLSRAKHLASRMATGQVFINKGSSGIPELPFGGIKQSGYGREMSDLGILTFMNAKIVVLPD